MTILVTGGAGFIGSNFVLCWRSRAKGRVVNVDKLTYAGNLLNLECLRDDPDHIFITGDICDGELMSKVLQEHQPSAIVHFAAESHVDRSIVGPGEFIRTNIVGTYTLLECIRAYLQSASPEAARAFRLLHISTDEVFGSLSEQDPAFCETTPYSPNSPYSASKASSDHLVRAYRETYGVPAIVTNCSNNYGPYQFPEKLIPFMICNALDGQALPIYGDGLNVRDWLYVQDHCEALIRVLHRGQPGATYNIGGSCERTNLDVVRTLCALLDEVRPDPTGSYERLIKFISDRPGHDRRYAMDTAKIRAEIGWRPSETLESGLRKTVQWYLSNPGWIAAVKSGSYREWVSLNYSNRDVKCGA